MQSVNIEAAIRKPGKSAAQKLKEEGYIPAILYGKGMESIPLAIQNNKLREIMQKHGRNVLLNVIVNGSTHNAIIKEIQGNTLKGNVVHVDFQRVSMYDAIESTVPLKFEGIGVVESRGGIVQHQVWEINVKSLPDKMPEEITIDLSNLKIGDTLYIKDVAVPEGIEKIDDPDEVVLSVLAPKAAEAEETNEATE